MTAPSDEAQRLIAAGNDLEDRGQLEEARQQYLVAATIAPASPLPWLNLGNVLERQGQPDAAVEAVETAIKLAPDFAPAYFNLGRLLAASGNLHGAEQAFRASIRLDSRFTDAALSLASLLETMGRVAEAESILRAAAASDPSHAGVIYNLGLMLMERDAFDEAETLMLRAITIAPDFGKALGAMGDICMKSRRAKDADPWLRRRMQAEPDSVEAAAALLFSLTARDDLDARQIYDAHREIGAVLEAWAAGSPKLFAKVGDRARIRVGYLSPDFRQHAVALFIQPILRRHDRSAFEIYCYYNHHSEDAVTRQLMPLADHWRNIADLDDDAAARLIRADEIDILVDLAGYTAHSRLLLFPRRCAPVQATWLGYLHSTGLASTDYRICDLHSDPPGMTEQLNSESLVRMPHSQWCYEPLHQVDSPASQPPLRAGRVVFGSFNQFWKISDSCLDLWLEILQRTPGAELRVVGVPQGKTTDAFRARVEQCGIPADRIRLSPRLDIQQYFAAIADVDIALDTMPYNGATTTLDALWMGVALVALAGDRAVARSATSILSTLGLPELVARTEAEYVDINVRLARDGEWRSRLRATLRTRLLRSPLMDSAQFTRDLEARYREIHARAVG